MSENIDQAQTIRVWDPLVRIFHWSLVAFFAIAFVTEDDWMDLHLVAGYSVAALIGFRLVWGVIGTHYARFTQFVKSPSTVIDYLRRMATFRVPHYLGHNPAAGAMIVALIISIILVSLSGMSIIAAEGSGPLADTFFAAFNAHWMEEIHEFLANFTLMLVGLHVAGVVVSSLLEGENLVRAMIHGRKRMHDDAVDKREVRS
jgi:cytochrome b